MALLLKSDRVVDGKEVELVLGYIKQHYEKDAKEIARLLKIALKINNDKFVKQSCLWLRETLSYAECLALTEFLFDVARISQNICKEEWCLLCDIMDRLGLEQDDIDYLSRKYSFFYSCGASAGSSGTASASSELAVGTNSQEGRTANAFRVLGLGTGASKADVQSAFRLLAKKYHPDTVQDENLKNILSEKFKEINAAYNLLIGWYEAAKLRVFLNGNDSCKLINPIGGKLGGEEDTTQKERRIRRCAFLFGYVVCLLVGNFSPAVFQTNGAVEDQCARFAVGVYIEVANTLELVVFQWLRVG